MRLEKVPSHSFHPPTAIHSSLGSHVYTFTNDATGVDSSSEEEIEIMELRPRGVALQQKKATREKVGDVVLLEHAVTEDDNLNKLALQYGCKVADIKRVNNFLTEQDMYALKTIKIPVKVHGIFTENSGPSSMQHGLSAISRELTIESDNDLSVSSSENCYITRYFQQIDQNIEAAAQDLLNESMESSECSLQVTPLLKQKDPNTGADWGIRWWNAVFIMLLIGIVVPVFYIIYYEKLSQPENCILHSNLTSNHSSCH